jgi:hypothetical protein
MYDPNNPRNLPLNEELIDLSMRLFSASGKALSSIRLSRANFYKLADELKLPPQDGCSNCTCANCLDKLKLKLLGVAGPIEVRADFDMPDNRMLLEWE